MIIFGRMEDDIFKVWRIESDNTYLNLISIQENTLKYPGGILGIVKKQALQII